MKIKTEKELEALSKDKLLIYINSLTTELSRVRLNLINRENEVDEVAKSLDNFKQTSAKNLEKEVRWTRSIINSIPDNDSEFKEILDRVESKVFKEVDALLLSLNSWNPGSKKTLQYREMTVVPSDETVMYNNETYSLTRSEFKIVYTLINNAGKIIRTSELPPNLRTHLYNLREKMGFLEIRTIRGQGYKVDL